ncbi:hypothetical protein [Pseudanabaena sp. lw0831]|uniref:hypothetical protein n=1 Tax=Pseudanabaena sp. lw0831 TaxID=1357935 RepID=UPI0019162B67|nr:hypothetical protein [Pseudanabaena sp. lw0831]
MKASSIFCISAIAASSLITLSTATLASAQPNNISANLSQTPQISDHSTQKIAKSAAKGGRSCPTLNPLCGWF